MSHVPIFAVAREFDHLPRRIAIAIDFSTPSLVAAKTALALWSDLSAVFLVHVSPHSELDADTLADLIPESSEWVDPAFTKLRSELAVPAGVTVETVALTGKPARALLDFARASDIDVIVTGSRGAGLVDRLLVGSTATALIRGASCSVLAVPSSLIDTPIGATHHQLAREKWAEALALFTRRNAGRVASLEVDDPEFGAQAQQHGYPFIGAAYDHHDQRVELMLGDMENSTRHLTRGIGDVHAIDLLQDADGHDRILRISHGSGHTTLTLAR
jgi:nucleotide-binding universal stress UspA family protein